MDRGLLGQEEASLEATRDLLIAISYSEPDKVEGTDLAESSYTSNGHIVSNGDRTNSFIRSELISISYPQPPTDEFLCNGGHA